MKNYREIFVNRIMELSKQNKNLINKYSRKDLYYLNLEELREVLICLENKI